MGMFPRNRRRRLWKLCVLAISAGSYSMEAQLRLEDNFNLFDNKEINLGTIELDGLNTQLEKQELQLGVNIFMETVTERETKKTGHTIK